LLGLYTQRIGLRIIRLIYETEKLFVANESREKHRCRSSANEPMALVVDKVC
jgi:hypothetical protein